jgi:uncharacterized membrane protein
MKGIEDLMNWLTDMDWGWWPMVSCRPAKDKDIDNRVLLKISPFFGCITGLLLFLLFASARMIAFNVLNLLAFLVLGFVAFFLTYKLSFAYFWNRRAQRLRESQKKRAPAE